MTESGGKAGGAPVTPSALESALAKLRECADMTMFVEVNHSEAAALLAKLEAHQWRPIETAPKDGTEFQGWLWSDMHRTGWWEPRCRYSADGVFQVWQRVDYVVEARPTHWLPKPTEPPDYRNPAPVAHTCHWPGCEKPVPPAMWGCKGHWFSLPKRLRDRIWKTYRPGQEITKTPSPEYVEAAQEVQRWITEFRAGNNHGAKP